MALVDIIGELKLTTCDANCCGELGEVWVMSMGGSVMSDVSLELSTWSLTLATLLPPEDVTNVADVGADLVGKVVAGLDEDDPNNPATIADNVGYNVGDIAGMGADLFGSFAESTCAALVIAAAAVEGSEETLSAAGWDAILFPLVISAAGIIVCILCSFVATHISPVKKEEDIEVVEYHATDEDEGREESDDDDTTTESDDKDTGTSSSSRARRIEDSFLKMNLNWAMAAPART